MAPVIVALAIDMVGTGIFLPVSLLYFIVVAGIPAGTVGICLTVANLISLPLPLLVGMLVDRIGSRLVVVIGLLLQGAGFLGYLAVRTPFWLVIAALTVAVGVRFFWSAVFTLVTERSEPERRDHWFGIFGAVQNAGIGVGSLISAGLVLLGTHAAYHFVIVVNGLSFVVAAAVVMLVGQSGNPATHEKEANEPSVPLGRNRPYLALIGINTIFALCSVMLGVGVPIYVDLGLHQPGWVTGVLFAANTVAIALLQTQVVRWLKGRRRVRIMMFSGILWAGWAVCLALAVRTPSILVVPLLFVVTAAFTTAEMTHGPTSNGLSAGASPVAGRGRYIAAFQYSWAFANVLAPALFTQLFAVATILPWIVIAALAALAAVAVRALERHLPAAALRT
ncbi:MFS transporter [Fodinicola feengrottensis]|uniref:MFS transporter n=2 Tax=Fodinicola feengrottensis TaxID=435914 RepID=A0ABN2FXG1_9ACTN